MCVYRGEPDKVGVERLPTIRTGFRAAPPGLGLPHVVRRRAVADAPRVAARRADGTILTLGDLPAADVRWTYQRKRLVVDCIELELLSPAVAERRYALGAAELGEWRELVLRGGRGPEVWPTRPCRISGGTVQAGDMAVDLDARTLTVAGSAVHLSDAEWMILACLAEAGGGIVSNAMLMGALYSGGRVRGRKIVDVLVCRLRQKLGLAASSVEVIWGRGYRLSVETELSEPVALSG